MLTWLASKDDAWYRAFTLILVPDLGVDKIIFYLDDIVLYSSAILFYTRHNLLRDSII